MTFTVAIIGRPNVGKSTLFNRLIGKKLAIVHDMPGVTRDRREGEASLGGMPFRVIDTAGLEEAFDESVESRMRQQTEKALEEADVALMLIDSRAGVTPLDAHFANFLRKRKTPVILVANKCEGKAGAPGLYEAYGLGLGEPVAISAEHGEGLGELFDALLPFAPKEEEEPFPEEEADEGEGEEGEQEQDDPTKPLRMAIVGRPNVGKSTLVNKLLGEDRMLTGPEAGLTRDSIAVRWLHEGRPVTLVDTAGLRRRANISDQVEKLAVAETIHAIRHAQVVVLVLDVAAILDKQDLTIARLAIEEGRALVIAVNKWDMVEDRAQALKRLQDRLESSMPQVRGIPTVTISALAGKGLDKLMAAVTRTYQTWNKRISTSQLNRWLEEMVAHHPPPVGTTGRRIKLRFMTQAKARPPTFVIMSTSRTEELPEAYLRYLVNSLRETFDLPGVPIRIFLRKRRNPYAESE
ncbi:ribosome biogenesis GTPase Der [Telmatospirillum sp. J64-1]|uniref:ribosome biogenesis GTPase Der n=1 Tax=Telmatospirillum sp. J64-1 TaxID=2502183 RepID=UPI00115DC5AC|nr:ribosome biogenesis GTPase Der [Telmatospirillum sp. J64-1]